jgi:rhodanese-related sulfurtransferase
MKFGIIILIVAVVGVALFAVVGNRNTADPSVTLQAITTDVTNGAALVDVRTPEEYKAEHAVSSVNIPLQDMQKSSFGNLNKDQKIYVYCRSGSRSAQSANLLKQAGYTNVVDIHTLSAWKKLGGQVAQS